MFAGGSWSAESPTRRRAIAVVLATMLGLLTTAVSFATLTATPAAAQSDCSVDADYPPTGPNAGSETMTIVDISLPPGGIGYVELSGANPGDTYDGFVYSTPLPLPATQAGADGSLSFRNLSVPADFEASATHSIDLCNGDVLVLSSSFCLDFAGDLATLGACQDISLPRDDGAVDDGTADDDNGGALAFTGIDGLDWMIRIAAVLLAVGFALRHWRRRREASFA